MQNANKVGLGFYIDYNEEDYVPCNHRCYIRNCKFGRCPILITGSLKYHIDIDASVKLQENALMVENIKNGTITDTQEIEDALNESINATVSYQNKFVADIDLRYNA